MPIRIDSFGGMAPKMAPELLPENGAVLAKNCAIQGGALVPASLPTHTETLSLTGNVSVAEMTGPDKPSRAPWLASSYWLCDSGLGWLAIQSWHFLTRAETEGPLAGQVMAGNVEPDFKDCTFEVTRRTETGFLLRVYVLPTGEKTVDPGYVYQFHGPIFRFLTQPGYNGPDKSFSLPVTPQFTDPTVPPYRIPLYYDGDIYGHFQVVSARGFTNAVTLDMTDSETSVTWSPQGGTYEWEVDLNYVEPRRRHFYYVSTKFDASDREGPPSEVSNEIIVVPGSLPVMGYDSDGYRMRLYRSSTGGTDDFRMVKDNESDGEWRDDVVAPPGDALEPFGSLPQNFVTGEVYWHPAGFAVGYSTNRLVWRSDLYRPWAWPEENSIPFPEDIKALVMSGNSVIVFTTNLVYAINGNDPEGGTATLLSDALPLVSTKSLARIGDRVYYSTYDGLVEVTGSGCKVVSGGYYDQATWTAQGVSSSTQAKVGDGRLFYSGLAFDFEEELAAVSLYDESGTTTWTSKVFRFDDRVTLDYWRVEATGTVTATLYADGVAVATLTSAWGWQEITYTSDRAWAWEWQVSLTTTGTVTGVHFVERQVMEAGDEVRLTAEQVPCFKNIWLRWPNRGNWAAASVVHAFSSKQPQLQLTPQTTDGVQVTVKSTDGVYLMPRTLPEAALWHVGLNTHQPMQQLTLYRRTREGVDGTLRVVNDGPVPPWRIRRYVFPGQVQPTAVTVQSGTAGSVSMNVYVDGAAAATKTYSVTPGVPVRLADLGTVHELDFDFGTSDGHVTEVILHASAGQDVGPDGVVFGDGAGWVGERFKFADIGRWALYSVWADEYPVTLKLYKDGAANATHSVRVTDGRVGYFDFTSSNAGTIWEAEVVAPGTVRRLLLVPWTRTPVEGPRLALTAQDLAYPPWRHQVFQWGQEVQVKSLWVDADVSSGTIPAYIRVDESKDYKVSLRPNVETPLPTIERCQQLRIWFPGYDDQVNAVQVHLSDTVAIGREGLNLVDSHTWRRLAVRGPERIQWATGMLQADDYTGLSLALYRDNVPVGAATDVTNEYAFRFDRVLGAYPDWVVDVARVVDSVQQPVALRSLTLLPWQTQPVEGYAIRSVRTEPGIAPWMYTRWEWTGPKRDLKSFRAQASETVYCRYYLDGATTPAGTAVLTPGVEATLQVTTTALHHSIDVDFVTATGAPADHLVTALDIFAEEVMEVGPEGIQLHQPPTTRMLPVRFPGSGRFAAAAVAANGNAIILRQYDGQLEVSEDFITATTGRRPVPLTEVTPYSEGYVDFQGTDIRSIILMPHRRQALQQGILEIRNEGAIPPWLYTTYQADRPVQLASFRVHHDPAPKKLYLYVNGKAVEVDSVVELPFSSTERGYAWGDAFDLYVADSSGNRYDHLVRTMTLYPEVVIPIEQTGVVLRQGEQVRSWRNVKLRFPDVGTFSVVRVVASAPVTMTLTCDGTQAWSGNNQSSTWKADNDVKLGALAAGRDWTLDVACEGRVDEVHLFGDVETAVENGSAVIRRHEQPFTWLARRIVAPAPMSFVAARVVASEYPAWTTEADERIRIRLYPEDDEDAAQVVTFANDSPKYLKRMDEHRRWRIDVWAPNDVLVREVGLATSMARLRA